jgi:DNA-binding transcriptional ArsR family regulator
MSRDPGPARELLARLSDVRERRKGWMAKCPAHPDRRASLSVDLGAEGRVLVNCYRGCSAEAIALAVGLTMADLFPAPSFPPRTRPRVAAGPRIVANYDYVDAQGELLYQVVRFRPKDFRLRSPAQGGGWTWGLNGMRRVLYRLPEVLAAKAEGRVVVIVEGEKDCLAVASIGMTATTIAGGANAPLPDDIGEVLAGATVAVVPDNDEPGRGYADRVARAIVRRAASVKIVRLRGLPEKGDVSDWLAAGGTRDALSAEISAAPEFVARPTSAGNDAQDIEQQSDRPTPRVGPQTLRALLARPELLEPPALLIPNVAYRGRVTLLSAREKAGKSTLTAQGVAELSRGGSFLNQSLEAATILWYAIDEPISDTVRRFQQYGADPDQVHICEDRPTAEQMRADIDATGADVVIIDTLTELWSGIIESDRDANDVSRFLRPYVVVARKCDVALVLLHHTTKVGREYRGSVQLGAGVDVVLTLRQRQTVAWDEEEAEPAPDDGRRVLTGKGRSGIVVDVRLAFDGIRYTLGDVPLPVRARILRTLYDAPASGTALSQLLGMRKQVVLAELKALQRDGLVEQGPKRYSLTDTGRLAVPTASPLGGRA